ncbi:MAG: ribosome-associated protein [Planctomycetota bacterium]|jgi:ribosome-associated protein
MTQEETGLTDAQESSTKFVPSFSSPATLAHEVGDLILEKKGTELTVINVEKVTSIADYLVITTAQSSRQVTSMAKEIREFVKAGGGNFISAEGADEGWWALIDLGDVIVHIMQYDARRYYDLDMLWADGRVVRQAAMPEAGEEVGESEDDGQLAG